MQRCRLQDIVFVFVAHIAFQICHLQNDVIFVDTIPAIFLFVSARSFEFDVPRV